MQAQLGDAHRSQHLTIRTLIATVKSKCCGKHDHELLWQAQKEGSPCLPHMAHLVTQVFCLLTPESCHNRSDLASPTFSFFVATRKHVCLLHHCHNILIQTSVIQFESQEGVRRRADGSQARSHTLNYRLNSCTSKMNVKGSACSFL